MAVFGRSTVVPGRYGDGGNAATSILSLNLILAVHLGPYRGKYRIFPVRISDYREQLYRKLILTFYSEDKFFAPKTDTAPLGAVSLLF